MLLFATCVAVQVLALHVCAEPDAAVAEIVYPALHTLQSTVDVSHRVAPEPVPMVGVPFGQVQISAVQVNVLKTPFVPHVAVPPPE